MNKSTQLRCRTIWCIIHKHLTVALQNSKPLPHPKPEHYVHNRTEVDNITWKLVSFLSPYAAYCLHVNLILSSTVELVLGVSFGFISGSKLQVCMKSMSWRARGSPRGKTSDILVVPADALKSVVVGLKLTIIEGRYHGSSSPRLLTFQRGFESAPCIKYQCRHLTYFKHDIRTPKAQTCLCVIASSLEQRKRGIYI